MEKKKIVIGADIVPTESNIKMFCEEDIRQVVGEELFEYLGDDTFLICNLETPLSNVSSPIIKCGPTFNTPEDAAKGLKALGVDLASLANNHIKDQGTEGIISTCRALDAVDINHVGVGENASSAGIPFFFWFNGKKIGVYSCSDHEFSSASENEYGANTFDALVSLDHISALKDSCDFIIVLYHGGKEYYRYPSPDLQRLCRRIADKGADLVICQHSHCIGAEEKYKKCTIVYGQGNFIFNKKNNEYWNSSLLICLDSSLQISYVPIVRTDHGTRMADSNEKKEILADFQKRSEQIRSPELLFNEYHVFSKSLFGSYISAFSGKKSKLWIILNRLTKGKLAESIKKRRYPKSQLALLKNYIECDAHRELIIQAIDDLLRE